MNSENASHINVTCESAGKFVVTLADRDGRPLKQSHYTKRKIAQMQAGRLAKKYRVRVEDDTLGEDVY